MTVVFPFGAIAAHIVIQGAQQRQQEEQEREEREAETRRRAEAETARQPRRSSGSAQEEALVTPKRALPELS